MARDDFSKKVLDILIKRVGSIRCSNPSCRKITTGPRFDDANIVNIGVGAHITAASKGGPRFDAKLTPKERKSPDNGIWFCQNCSKLVDNDPARFTIEILRHWKQRAEAAALSGVEGQAAGDLAETLTEIELSFKKDKIQSDRHDYFLTVDLTNRGTVPLGQYHVDVEIPARVVHEPQNQVQYVREQSTQDIALFRVASQEHRCGDVIYPGETKTVMTIHYFMDDKIYRSRGSLFAAPVRATLYHHGYRPVTIEKPFEELQIF